jgi:hypothetical protein
LFHGEEGGDFSPPGLGLVEFPAEDLKAGLVAESGDCGFCCFPWLPAKHGDEGLGCGVDGDLALVHSVDDVKMNGFLILARK